MMVWIQRDPQAIGDHLGFIPSFLSEDDPLPAADQIHRAYTHGGGWYSISGFKYGPEHDTLCYPGDPPMRPLFETKLRDERILVYPHAFVAVFQPDGSFDVARID